MNRRNGKLVRFFGAAVMLGAAATANAAPVITTNFNFDPDGAGPLGTLNDVAAFDWGPDSALSDGGGTAINNFVANSLDGGQRPTTFNLYTHGVLSILRNASNQDVTPGSLNGPGPNAFEITFVAGFQENVVSATGTPGMPGNQATFGSTGATGEGIPNFFEVYFDTALDADPLAGTGYNNGTRIIAGTVNPAIATTLFSLIGGGAGTPLDGFGGDNYPALDSVTGFGATQLDATITFQDNNFVVGGDVLLMSIFNTFNNLNFIQVDPSAAFVKAPLGAAPVTDGAGEGITSLGAVNGNGVGPDVQFQTDGTNSFIVLKAEVPEPMTAVMGIVALGGLMMSTRRRRLA